jgi:HrpA-like RNA helicase
VLSSRYRLHHILRVTHICFAGDILVFLTGQAEIEKAVARLNDEVRMAGRAVT